jgi:hypothetical protein
MMRTRCRKWTDAEKAYVLAGHAAGLSDYEMADTLGRTRCSVSSWRLDRSKAKPTPTVPADCSSVPVPMRPRGYSPTQLLWARAYEGDRQADLITSIATGKLVGLGYRPRT